MFLFFIFLVWHRCENCVEMLFVRGAGNCVQCNTPLRKNNFRVQLFEDPTVDKEVEIRKKVMKMWVGGIEIVRWRGVVLCVYVLYHPSSHFLNCLCLCHYTVCFVDNESPWGVSNGLALSLPNFTSQPLPGPALPLLFALFFYIIPLNLCSNVCHSGGMQKWY